VGGDLIDLNEELLHASDMDMPPSAQKKLFKARQHIFNATYHLFKTVEDVECVSRTGAIVDNALGAAREFRRRARERENRILK